MPPRLCLLTVHGIGFQQPPEGERDGYADGLHAHLRTVLGDRLGEDCGTPADPGRAPGGPVYVQSEWEGKRELGLQRLAEPLVSGGDVAHVALVYSPSLPSGHHLGETVETALRAFGSLGRYTSVVGALKLLGRDLWAVVHHPHDDAESNLRPRTDDSGTPKEGSAASTNVLAAIEADIATYVSRNDLRERVRGFVQEAILRLLRNPEVGVLVVNTHSQGSVLCWDVLCRLPFFTWSQDEDRRAGMVRAFVTAGSPIRKYVDLFDWGGQVGQMAALSDSFAWHNFYDERDPVADPLRPPKDWKPGQPVREPTSAADALLVAVDPTSGEQRPFGVADTEVDNVAHSTGGGLQAHDYWNNESQFVAALARLIEDVAR